MNHEAITRTMELVLALLGLLGAGFALLIVAVIAIVRSEARNMMRPSGNESEEI